MRSTLWRSMSLLGERSWKGPSCRGYLQGGCIGSWWIPAINGPHLLKFIQYHQINWPKPDFVTVLPHQRQHVHVFLVNTTYHFPALGQSINQRPAILSGYAKNRLLWVSWWLGGINPIRSPDVSDAHQVSSLFCANAVFLWMFWVYVFFYSSRCSSFFFLAPLAVQQALQVAPMFFFCENWHVANIEIMLGR